MQVRDEVERRRRRSGRASFSGRPRDGPKGSNPPATLGDYQKARAVALTLARRYAARGARAVVLAGSWSRRDARQHSDIDLWVIGSRVSTKALWHSPFVVNVCLTTADHEKVLMSSPRRAGACVPGWKGALVLHDPHGVAARLKRRAHRFRYADISKGCDRWVRESIGGWAEEVVKINRALAEGRPETAAVQRNALAGALGHVMAVHRRVFWDSENGFWERIGRDVGGAWQTAQRRALGTRGESLVESCRASVELYRLTTRAVWRVLDSASREIASHACEVAGVPPPRRGR